MALATVSGPAVSRAGRLRSRDPEAFGLPSGREEEWRFTPLARLDGLLDGGEATGQVEMSVQGGALGELAPGDARVGSAFEPGDRVSALALDRGRPMLLSASGEVRLAVQGRGGLAYDHLVVEVAPGDAATLVVEHTGAVDWLANTEFLVGDGAVLSVVSLHAWEPAARHAGEQAVLLGRDAAFSQCAVLLGGGLLRLTPSVRFAGPGGRVDFDGIFATGAGQHHESRLFIDHQQPNCRSRVRYKTALLQSDAHTVWVGDVLIGAGASGTDTYELNRNLVLADGARADSVPNLEIETGEVAGAGHASATGRFDDEQLFYLMARGIPAREARRLVVRGFFADIVERIPVPEMRERLTSSLLAALDAGAQL